MRLRTAIFYLVLCILPVHLLEADIRGQFLEQPSEEKDPIILYPHLALGEGFQVVLLASNSTTSAFEGTVRLPLLG